MRQRAPGSAIPDTLDWLGFLLPFAPAAPLLVVAARRGEEVEPGHTVYPLRLGLRRTDRITEIVDRAGASVSGDYEVMAAIANNGMMARFIACEL